MFYNWKGGTNLMENRCNSFCGLMDSKIQICMTALVCVCVLYNISEVCVCVCVCVCEDSLPVDPQGLEWEQVYCSVSQPCQDTRTHRASHVHLSPPLISLCLLLYFALSLFTLPSYLQSLFFCPPSLLVSSSCFSALLLLLPNELNPTTPFKSFFICIPCLCLNLTKCPRVIVLALSRPWGTLVLSLLLFHYVSLMGLWGFISPRRKSSYTPPPLQPRSRKTQLTQTEPDSFANDELT